MSTKITLLCWNFENNGGDPALPVLDKIKDRPHRLHGSFHRPGRYPGDGYPPGHLRGRCPPAPALTTRH
jgi:hypothetical protein